MKQIECQDLLKIKIKFKKTACTTCRLRKEKCLPVPRGHLKSLVSRAYLLLGLGTVDHARRGPPTSTPSDGRLIKCKPRGPLYSNTKRKKNQYIYISLFHVSQISFKEKHICWVRYRKSSLLGVTQ